MGGDGKDASYLKAPGAYGRTECYETGFANTQPSSVWAPQE
jgi:hypothetical protein